MVPTFVAHTFASALSGLLAVVVAVSSGIPWPSSTAPASGVVVGADVSWPNCPKGMGMPSRKAMGLPLPRPTARFVVIGLTNGPAFHPNPCLVAQVAFARERHLWAAAYAVATYPTRAQLSRYGAAGPHAHTRLNGRLWNTGWAQARQNVARMRDAGLRSPVVWVDVETVSEPAPWSRRPARNAAVVDGVVQAYRASGLRVGFYSTRRLWRTILGGATYRLPEWRTAGETSRAEALGTCRSGSFQGGRAVLAQWWDARRDHDALCAGRPASDVLRDYFVRF